MKPNRLTILLAICSGIFLGCAFPPVPAGILAFFAFVLFFIVFEQIDTYGRAFGYSYLIFLVFNVITLYWTGGFTHGRDGYLMLAGGALVVVHPVFFFIPVAAMIFLRRQFSARVSVLSFPFLWVAFEYLHSKGEMAFPWLTVGNTQTYNTATIQFAAFTGVYGISFWILTVNVLLYLVYSRIAAGRWQPLSGGALSAVVGIFLLFLLPTFYGMNVLREEPPTHYAQSPDVRVAIVQPNIDPFEKWVDTVKDRQLDVLRTMTRRLPAVDLVLWPETAVPFYILSPENRLTFALIKHDVDSLHTSLLTGIPDSHIYRGDEKAPKSSKITRGGIRYDTYNGSMLLQAGRDTVQRYSKTLLVPFGERVPFSEELSFLNAMQWNFGLGGWGIGNDTTVFQVQKADSTGTSFRFAAVICYESIYPGYVAAFVKKGAEFLTVITNDSWWGNTSGAYQHRQFAALRAVENRRWIARCGNGGISCLIDPYGHFVETTDLYTRTTLIGNVQRRTDLTFYTEHGDWFAELVTVLSLLILAAAAGKHTYSTLRQRQDDESH